jgi:5'-3' exonuclease
MKFLIDAMNIAFRAHHVYDVQQGLATSQGLPTGMVYGFFKILARWKRAYPEHDFCVVWDRAGGRKIRQDIYPDYKANRQETVTEVAPEEVTEALGDNFSGMDPFNIQLDLIRGMLTPLGIDQVSAPYREADDVLAHMVRRVYGDEPTIILTSDRDMLQLVSRTTILITPDGKKTYDPDKVFEEYGVVPSKLLQLRSLCGDKSDNLPGLPRFRKKTSARLVNEFGDVNGIYAQDTKKLNLTKKEAEKFVIFKDQAFINLEVMRLRDEDCQLDFVSGSRDDTKLLSVLKTLEITTLQDTLLDLHKPPLKQGTLRFQNELRSTN